MRMSVFVCRLLQCPSLSSVDRTGSWLCLRRLSTPAHLLKRSRLSCLIHLWSWLLPGHLPQWLLFLLLLYFQARVKPRKNWRTQIRIWIWSLWLILSEQPTQAAWFVKHGNKGQKVRNLHVRFFTFFFIQRSENSSPIFQIKYFHLEVIFLAVC